MEEAAAEEGVVADLHAWMSQFSYTPGMEYVRVERVSPSTVRFRGQDVSTVGWLVDLDQPVTLQAFWQYWGGGTYLFRAIQIRGPSQTKMVVETKRAVLSGQPLRVPVPGADPVVLMERFDVQNQPSATASAVSLDAAHAAQLNERLLAAMRPDTGVASKQLIDLLQADRATAQQQLDYYREQIARAREDGAKPHIEALAQLRQMMNETARDHDRLIAEMRQTAAAALAEQRSQFENRVAEVRRDAQQQLVSAQDATKAELHRLTQRCSELEGELRRRDSEHVQTLREMRMNQEQLLSEARARFNNDLATARELISTTFSAQITQLQESLAVERRRGDDERVQRAEAIRAAENHVRTMMETAHRSELAATTQALVHRAEAAERQLQVEVERSERLTTEAQELRAQLMTRQDPNAQLEAVGTLLNKMELIRGPSNTGPTGLIERVATVAPQLKAAFLDPVLQRVDAATSLAQTEIAARNQALRQQATRPRVASRQLTSRRQGAQTQQPNTTRPSAPESPEQMVNTALARLEQAFDSNVTPGQAAAAAMAALPAEFIATIRATPADVVVSQLHAAVTAMSLPSLSSPAGEAYLRAVVAAVMGG